jgi:hypothetical protein
MSSHYYQKLKAVESLESVIDPTHFIEAPEDWSVVITDVVNSTSFIEAGKYKDVNIAGGLAAMALSNYFHKMDFPFLFGGDGITFLIPNNSLEDIKSILCDTKKKVNQFFDLILRVGIVPISELKANNKSIFIGKWKISEYYNQAILLGAGVDYCEKLIKEPSSHYTITDDYPITIEANFQGFTCRWKDIISPQGETVNIIVKFNEIDPILYREILSKINSILGKISDYHPLNEKNLQMSSSLKQFKKEAIAISQSTSKIKNFIFSLKIFMETIFTNFVVYFQIPIKIFFYDLKKIKSYNINSSDFQKFDGNLKMVVSISSQKRKVLENFLRLEEDKGHIYFGMHISDRALLTCLMHNESVSEVHFVDGANGGYAVAAKNLKLKLKK